MNQLLQAYRASQALLQGRMQALRHQLRTQPLTELEQHDLERRRRTLVAEIYEQEQIIRQLDHYLQETEYQKGGDGPCA